MMERRAFLKLTGMAAITAALPRWMIADAAKSVDDAFREIKFNPGCEYSRAVAFYGNFDQAYVISCLAKNLQQYVPGRYLLKVQFRRLMPADFGRYHKIAWVYSPGNPKGYLGVHGKWAYQASDGYFLWVKA